MSSCGACGQEVSGESAKQRKTPTDTSIEWKMLFGDSSPCNVCFEYSKWMLRRVRRKINTTWNFASEQLENWEKQAEGPFLGKMKLDLVYKEGVTPSDANVRAFFGNLPTDIGTLPDGWEVFKEAMSCYDECRSNGFRESVYNNIAAEGVLMPDGYRLNLIEGKWLLLNHTPINPLLPYSALLEMMEVHCKNGVWITDTWVRFLLILSHAITPDVTVFGKPHLFNDDEKSALIAAWNMKVDGPITPLTKIGLERTNSSQIEHGPLFDVSEEGKIRLLTLPSQSDEEGVSYSHIPFSAPLLATFLHTWAADNSTTQSKWLKSLRDFIKAPPYDPLLDENILRTCAAERKAMGMVRGIIASNPNISVRNMASGIEVIGTSGLTYLITPSSKLETCDVTPMIPAKTRERYHSVRKALCIHDQDRTLPVGDRLATYLLAILNDEESSEHISSLATHVNRSRPKRHHPCQMDGGEAYLLNPREIWYLRYLERTWQRLVVDFNPERWGHRQIWLQLQNWIDSRYGCIPHSECFQLTRDVMRSFNQLNLPQGEGSLPHAPLPPVEKLIEAIHSREQLSRRANQPLQVTSPPTEELIEAIHSREQLSRRANQPLQVTPPPTEELIEEIQNQREAWDEWLRVARQHDLWPFNLESPLLDEEE